MNADADPDDDQLLARAARGERRAFDGLVARHLAPTYALARRLLDSDAEAEDVTQEAFTRMWLKAPQWRPGAARLATWLYRVTVNLCHDSRRRRPPPAVELDPEDPSHGTSGPAEGPWEADQTVNRVAQAVATLPERQRAAIALTYTSGLPNAEAAAALGVSLKAFEALLVRAKRELRRQLVDLA